MKTCRLDLDPFQQCRLWGVVVNALHSRGKLESYVKAVARKPVHALHVLRILCCGLLCLVSALRT